VSGVRNCVGLDYIGARQEAPFFRPGTIETAAVLSKSPSASIPVAFGMGLGSYRSGGLSISGSKVPILVRPPISKVTEEPVELLDCCVCGVRHTSGAHVAQYHFTIGGTVYTFDGLRELLAKASPHRSGDVLAGLAAGSEAERAAACHALADVPLTDFLEHHLIPYEEDDVTRLIVDGHDPDAFAPLRSETVGGFRDWLLGDDATTAALSALAPGLMPEMVAAVSKLMRNQDLIAVAQKCRVVTGFRSTLGEKGRLGVRLQPNHPTDDPMGIAASILDGLMYGCGDALIGINPATDGVDAMVQLLHLVDDIRTRFSIPTQSCVLAHVTTAMEAMTAGAPVDLVFQSIAGTQAANESFGIGLAMLEDAREMAISLGRGTVGDNVMYFETGQGAALSAEAHHGVDQQTVEARAYAVARAFKPFLTNTVVGFIGPEYLYDGKQITRAGLEDHFCGKVLGVPMGVDVCYTNHAEADQNDMDGLLTLLGVAGCTFIMGVPGADDIMLSYQSTSFHDALYVRDVLGLRPAPEFEAWLRSMDIMNAEGLVRPQLAGGTGAAQLLGFQGGAVS